MFLLNSCLGRFSAAYISVDIQAPLIPKLRGQFAEFLNNTSLVRLKIFSSSTCVGLRYGYIHTGYLTFSCQCDYNYFVTYFSLCLAARVFPLPRLVSSPASVKAFIACIQCRNLYLLSIDYAFRPRLRSRLTLGGRTFPRKP